MTAVADGTIEARIRAAESDVIEAVLRRGEPLVVVQSPPGAGKTGLVEAAAATAHAFGLKVAVATVTNDQAHDLVRRLARDFAGVPTQLLHSTGTPPPAGVAAGAGRVAVTDPRLLSPGRGVVVATSRKLHLSVPHLSGAFDLLVVDEAYQGTYAAFRPLAALSRQSLLVGDPGQLPPVLSIDTTRFEAAEHKVHWPAPMELLRAHPEVEPHHLPATRRLPQDTVDVVQPAFYPDLPFVSAAPPRELAFAAAGLGAPIDRALDLLASGASIVALTLPSTDASQDATDPELAELAASVASRMLERQPSWTDWTGARRIVGEEGIGVIDAHVAGGAEIERAVRARRLGRDLRVSTPETWQGLERPLTIVKHPLSGRPELDEFAMAAGRLCVMTSRHQVGCVIVTRDGIGDELLAHVHDSATRPSGSRDGAWDGFSAHVQMWQFLRANDRVVPI